MSVNAPKIALEAAEVEALITARRYLHAHPELSFEEHGTCAYLEARLADAGITQVSRVAETGLVALIEGAHPGPTLAFRGDIDALPIHEDSDKPYCSTRPGVMHACGHDVHATLALGVAIQLHRRRDALHGRVKVIFQPAEEASPRDDAPIGAQRMVEEGVLRDPDVDAILAMHCMPTLEVGKIGYTGGPVWARSELVEIAIEGVKTHAAYPHSGIDAVLVASQVVVALQSVVSRGIDARQPCVLSVGKLEAGESYNIIADSARLTGILRSLSDETSATARAQIERIVAGVCAGFGATGRVKFTPGARLTANAPQLEASVVSLLREAVGEARLVAHLPQLGAEDFAAFSTRVPGCYLFLGVRNEGAGITHMIHTPRFDVDEACLALGVEAMTAALLGLGARW